MADAADVLPRRKKASGKHALKDRICRRCCTSFLVPGDNDRVYCSAACRAEDQAIKRMARRAPASFVVAKCKCVECGSRFDRSRLVPFCSERCRSLHRGKEAAGERQAKICPECGLSFVAPYGRGHSRYCSNACSKRTNKRISRTARKARQRSVTVESVNPIRVFDRDGWKCHLCGRTTPRRLRGTFDPRAPELDHVLPLSQGGQHSYLNTACSCRECNLAKSGSLIGQLRLFG